MPEKFPQNSNESDDGSERSSLEGAGIPLYERLDEASKAFVLEVKHLSEIPEAQFLKENPKVLEALHSSQEQQKSKYTLTGGFLHGLARRFGGAYLDESFLKDKGFYLGSMWELTRLRLLELQDNERMKVPGVPSFYSKQTDYLVTNILERFADMLRRESMWQHSGPELQWGLLEDLATKPLPEETRDKLNIVQRMMNAYHQYSQYSAGGEAPFFQKRISDLWRYVTKRMKSFRGKSKIDFVGPRELEEYQKYANEFFDGLSNLSLTP